LDILLTRSKLDTSTLLLCDCGFVVTFQWIKAFENACSLHVYWPDSVIAYNARLQEFDAVQAELIAYRPAMDGYLMKAYPAK